MWPPEALEFLRELEDNNDRDWFKANRARYDDHLLAPARELAGRLPPLGGARFSRPSTHPRFPMRPPIKEQLGVAVGYGGAGGFYFELSLDGLFIGGGLHHPATDQLARFRAAIDDGRRAAGFERALQPALAAGLTLTQPELKRAPRGYPQDHPPLDRLRLKSMTAGRRHELEPWLHKPRCDEVVVSELDSVRPLVAWLGKHVGPSQQPMRP